MKKFGAVLLALIATFVSGIIVNVPYVLIIIANIFDLDLFDFLGFIVTQGIIGIAIFVLFYRFLVRYLSRIHGWQIAARPLIIFYGVVIATNLAGILLNSGIIEAVALILVGVAAGFGFDYVGKKLFIETAPTEASDIETTTPKRKFAYYFTTILLLGAFLFVDFLFSMLFQLIVLCGGEGTGCDANVAASLAVWFVPLGLTIWLWLITKKNLRKKF